MSVKFFGQFLIDQGELDASHLRDALGLMARANPAVGELAIERGYLTAREAAVVSAAQRHRDQRFGDLAVDLGFLRPEQLVEILHAQRACRIPIGQALVQLGHIASDRLGTLLDAYKTDQAQFQVGVLDLPDGLTGFRVGQLMLELLPRFMMRIARLPVKVGCVRPLDSVPDFAEVRVSVPLKSTLGLEVALVSDLDFAIVLARASGGLSPVDLDVEMIEDGVGEFMNVLAGNAATAMSQEGHSVELGPPDYDAEICDGWLVDLAVGQGQAAVVLSTF